MKKNHKKIDLNELHKTQLEMLKEFDQLCNDNNLTYFLTGGTLLGSVRHQGFIPWDDDIDLGMPREDYIKLQKIFEKNDEKYFLQHFDSDPYFGIPISKLRRKNTYYPEKVLKNNQGHKGVFIDIFPWDYIPKNIFKKIFQKLLLKPLKRMVLIKKNYSLTNKEKSKQILNGILKMVSVVIPTKMLIFL